MPVRLPAGVFLQGKIGEGEVGDRILLLGGGATICRSAAPREFPDRWAGVSGARDTDVTGKLGSPGVPASERPRRGRRRANAPTVQARPHYAASEATGGLCAGAGHRARWRRIFSITADCSMKAMIRMGPAHRGHTRGSTSYTCLMRRAQARVAAEAETSRYYIRLCLTGPRLGPSGVFRGSHYCNCSLPRSRSRKIRRCGRAITTRGFHNRGLFPVLDQFYVLGGSPVRPVPRACVQREESAAHKLNTACIIDPSAPL